MALYKFQVSLEDYDDLYRVIEIKPSQNFEDLHFAILSAFGFDHKHLSSFYMSDDNWRKGDELTLEEMGKEGIPLMKNSKISSFIENPHQKIIFLYDYLQQWTFLLELKGVVKEEDPKRTYPFVAKSMGIAPKQYNNIGVPNVPGSEEEDEFDFIKNVILAKDEPDEVGEEGVLLDGEDDEESSGEESSDPELEQFEGGFEDEK